MIIVNVNSQLGNQMFQYAIYRKLQLQGKEVKADLHYYLAHPEHFQLPIFGIELKAATEKECQIERDEYRTFMDRLRRKIFGKRQNIVSEITSASYDFNPRVFQLKRGYIDGYWQSEKYFEDIEDELRKTFTFPALNDAQNENIVQKIKSTTSISIHVRRGDYLGGFPIMGMDYYTPAMQYFIEKYPQAHFYVFSNDMDWCKKNLLGDNIDFVDWNMGDKSFIDMYLMSQCQHHIIANSSFSWWAAWLNTNPQKEVIAPRTWFFHAATPDIHCKGWIAM